MRLCCTSEVGLRRVLDGLDLEHCALRHPSNPPSGREQDGMAFFPILGRGYVPTIPELNEVGSSTEARPDEGNETENSREAVWHGHTLCTPLMRGDTVRRDAQCRWMPDAERHFLPYRHAPPQS